MLAVADMTSAVSIDAVYFGQSHLWKPDHPYFGLVGDRDHPIRVDENGSPSDRERRPFQRELH